MNRPFFISDVTRQRLAHPAAPGGRHAEIVKTAGALVAAGLNGEAVFHQIRPSYASDVSDVEIRSVIRWAEQRLPVSASSHGGAVNRPIWPRAAAVRSDIRPQTSPETAIARFLGGFSCGEADLWEASPIRLPDSWRMDAEALLNALYSPSDSVNVVTAFALDSGKARPLGFGRTAKRDDWLSVIRESGPPVSESGVWIRPNPTDGNGIADANIAVYRFALVEFDAIPISLQLPFVARLPVPIAAVITSGGKSLHAWISIRAETADAYRCAVSELFRLLEPFGVDTANRNPSRLSRLPGVFRAIGGTADNRQRLLYLNPSPSTAKIIP